MIYSVVAQKASETAPVVVDCAHSWVDVLTALLTPSIAVVAVVIALQQWKINRDRLRMDLFEKRYEVFIGVRALYEAVITTCDRLDDSNLREFDRKTLQVAFLFRSPTIDYVAEMRSKVVDLLGAYEEVTDEPQSQEAKARRREIVGWFRQQGELTVAVFAPLLRCTS